MAQTEVVFDMVIGQEGGIADNMFTDKISRPVEVGGGVVPFGRAVVIGTDPETVTLPSAGGQGLFHLRPARARGADPLSVDARKVRRSALLHDQDDQRDRRLRPLRGAGARRH